MKVERALNRVEIEQKLWDDAETRFKETFKNYPDPTRSRAFQIEKLEYYEQVQRKYINSPDADERLGAKFLAEKKSELENQLYPSRTLRFLRRVFNMISPPVVQVLNQPEVFVVPIDPEQKPLKSELLKSGFGSILNQVDQMIKEGHEEIKIPLALHFKPGERTEFIVGIKRDDLGNYQFLGFQAGIPDKKNITELISQRYYHDSSNRVTASMAYNQLNGRAVKKEYGIGEHKQTSLAMLDFNDKDYTGNFKIKEMPIAEEFNLKQLFAGLPLKIRDEAALRQLEDRLFKGNQEQVTFSRNGTEQTFYIELNPMQKSLTIYDEHHKKISLQSALAFDQRETKVELKVERNTENSKGIELAKNADLKVIKGAKVKTKVSVS